MKRSKKRKPARALKSTAPVRRVGVRKHRFWPTVLALNALKKLGNPDGLPSFFRTPIIQNCEAPLERQFLMQSQENSRKSPYGDVGLPASAGISLCETAGRLRGRLLVSIRRRFINKTAEPFVVV